MSNKETRHAEANAVVTGLESIAGIAPEAASKFLRETGNYIISLVERVDALEAPEEESKNDKT
jgi:hypothetical protein